MQGCLAELELIVVLVQHKRNLTTQEPHVYRPMMCGDGWDDLLDFMSVAGIDHSHVWHRAEQGEVFRRLVARTVAGGETRQGADDLHVAVFFRDRLMDEIVGAARSEHRIGRSKGHESFSRHARSRTVKQLFRHTHLIVAIGKLPRENVQIRVLAEIGRESDDLGTAPRQFDEGVAERRRLRPLTLRRDRRDHCRGGKPRLSRRSVSLPTS